MRVRTESQTHGRGGCTCHARRLHGSLAILWSVLLLLVVGSLEGAEKGAAPTSRECPLHKTSYRVIDIHAHAPFPSEAAVRAYLEVLDRIGVHAFNVLLFEASGWTYPGGWSEPNLLAWLELRKRFPEQVLVSGTVDFRRAAKDPSFFTDIPEELRRAASRGMQGIKIWKNLGMHYRDADGRLLQIDDPRLDPFWETCGQLGVPVLIHTADPKEYWYPNTFNTFQYRGSSTAKYFQHPDVPGWEELIRQRNQLLKRHPKTQFVGAHFASLSDNFDELAKTLDEYPNLSVDCSARLRFMYRYHPQAVRDFFVKYQDRILFGTDHFLMASPSLMDDADGLRRWQEEQAISYSRYLEYFETDHSGIIEPNGAYREWMRLRGIKLPPEVLEKLYHGNAERLIPSLRRANR